MPIQILLVDDHQVVRQGLRALLESEKDMKVIGETGDGRSAVELAAKMSPDIVVMDIAMPHLNGIEATRRLLAQTPAAKVVALSMHSDRRFLTEALKAGASAYLLKDSAFDELAVAIRSVFGGQTYLSPRITEAVVEGFLNHAFHKQPGAYALLTPREREVLQLIAEGQATKQVAATLHVSVKTVETHRRQIMEKLDIHSVAELTKYAIREGLSSIEA